MISPNTPPGTKIVCINVRDCFSSCRCGGNHDLGPLSEGRVYTLRGRPDVGFCVHVEEIFRPNPAGGDVGYAPHRFRVVQPARYRANAPERVPVRIRELEDA